MASNKTTTARGVNFSTSHAEKGDINIAYDARPSSSRTYDHYGIGTLPIFLDTYLSYSETLFHIYLPIQTPHTYC